MNFIKILLITSIAFALSCSTAKSIDNASNAEKTSAVKSTADTPEETINIYGLIKEDAGNVFVVTNWKSKSMVTYTVAGIKKSELAENKGKYASVSGVLTNRQTWSGTIEVNNINSIDETPDPRQEKFNKFVNRKPVK